MELEIDTDCPQGEDDIKIPTHTEHQTELDCPQG